METLPLRTNSCRQEGLKTSNLCVLLVDFCGANSSYLLPTIRKRKRLAAKTCKASYYSLSKKTEWNKKLTTSAAIFRRRLISTL